MRVQWKYCLWLLALLFTLYYLLAIMKILLLAGLTSLVGATSPALNPYNQNTIDNSSITLYYNGTGPVPAYDLKSPLPDPITPFSSSSIEAYFFNEFSGIINGSSYSDNCTKCIASVELMHIAAISQPVSTVTSLLIDLFVF